MKINTHTSHPSAFISSTFLDLRGERASIASALHDRGVNVNALDVRPASNNSSKNEILNGIRESDFLILVVGDRFGSIMPSITESESNSVTMWEYLKAITFGKPVIAYFRSSKGSHPQDHDDPAERAYQAKRTRFEYFKKLVTTRHNPAYFDTTEELRWKVDTALISIYREGVKKLQSENSALASKVAQLESEISRLRQLPQTGLAMLQPNPLVNALGGLSADTQTNQFKNTLLDLIDKKT